MGPNLRVYGTAPFCVAVVHGGPGAAGEMAPVARRLSEAYGVLEPLQTACSVAGQVDELRGVLAEHASRPPIIVGHSWGAWLSLLFAAAHPAFAAKLILVSSGPFTEKYSALLRTARLSRLDEIERAEYDAIVAALHDPAGRNTDALLEKLGRLAAKTDSYAPMEESPGAVPVHINAEVYRAVWKDAAHMRHTGELLARISRVVCPVVAIHGDSDSTPAAGVCEPLSSALPNFRFILLPRCGHTPWLERFARDQFYRILLEEIGSPTDSHAPPWPERSR